MAKVSIASLPQSIACHNPKLRAGVVSQLSREANAAAIASETLNPANVSRHIQPLGQIMPEANLGQRSGLLLSLP